VRAARGAPTPRPPAAPARPRVLVIDDSLTTRTLEQSILEAAGYDVDVAVSGEDGLARARERRYALYVCDVEMPGIDGFEFVARTRADQTLRETPAVLMTSLGGAEHRRRGVEVGASDYIVKSEFEQAAFLETVRRLARAS
jgi:two-component system chemotaxis sensor kinase CheA